MRFVGACVSFPGSLTLFLSWLFFRTRRRDVEWSGMTTYRGMVRWAIKQMRSRLASYYLGM